MGGFNYNPVNQSKVNEVKLCGFDDPNFKKYQKRIQEKSKKKTTKKRKKDYKKYKKEIKKFKKTLNALEKTEPKTIFDEAKFERPKTCGKCTESRNDKYRKGKNTLACWWNKSFPSKPRKVKSDTKKEDCPGYKSKRIKLVTPFLNEELEMEYRRFRYAKKDFERDNFTFDNYIKLAWAISGLDKKKTHYQPKWIRGILNQFTEKNFDLSLAKKADEYEKKQRQYIINLTEGESLERVLKFKYKDEDFFRFKVMDLLLEYENNNYIFEITKAWNLKGRNKIQQIRDYKFLLNKTTRGKLPTEKVLVLYNEPYEKESIPNDITTWETFKDKNSLEENLSLADFVEGDDEKA